MARYDMKSAVKQSMAVDFQTINTDTTTNGNKIDLSGITGSDDLVNSITFFLICSGWTAGDATLLIQDSDDNVTFADVTDTFLSGTEAVTTVDAAQEITSIGYVGKKRYVRASIVSDNSANLVVGVIAVKGHSDVPIA